MAEIKIGNREFKVEPVLAKEGAKLIMRMGNVLGVGLAHLGDVLAGAGEGASKEEKERSNASAILAIGSILQNGDPDKVADLLEDVLGLAQIKRESGVYDMVDMNGDLTHTPEDIQPLFMFVLSNCLGRYFKRKKNSTPRKTTAKA